MHTRQKGRVPKPSGTGINFHEDFALAVYRKFCIDTTYPVWKAQIDETPYSVLYVQANSMAGNPA